MHEDQTMLDPNAGNYDDVEEPQDELIGATIADRYVVKGKLGQGAMGAVYKAEHTMMGKSVAIKVLLPEMSTHHEIVERFQREARAAAAIEHPNICSATDFGQLADGSFFLVMEFLDGRTLDDEIAARRVLGPRRTIAIIDQLLGALQEAHALNIVHRDLKPENIMLVDRAQNQDFVKITDFGIASVKPSNADETDARLTRAGVAFGTPAYMSPEQVAGAMNLDHRSDLYSVGVIMFELLTGTVPFQGANVAAVMAQHLTVPAPSLRQRAPHANIPPALELVVLKLMAKSPDERFQSANELRQTLAELAQTTASVSATLLDAPPTTTPPRPAASATQIARATLSGENKKYVVIGGVVLLFILCGALVLASSLATEAAKEDVVDELASSARAPRPTVDADLTAQREAFAAEHAALLQTFDAISKAPDQDLSEIGEQNTLSDSPHFHYYAAQAYKRADQLGDATASSKRAITLDRRYAGDNALQQIVLDGAFHKRKQTRAQATALASEHFPDALRARALDAALAPDSSGRTRRHAKGHLDALGAFDELPTWQQGTIELYKAMDNTPSVAFGPSYKKACRARKRAITKLTGSKDPRAKEALEHLARRPKKGCGVLKNADCYACNRAAIKRALKTAPSE